MQDISRNRNPANLPKATRLYESLCEIAEKNEINKSVTLSHGGYRYILDLNEDVLKIANDKKEKTYVAKETLIDILSQFNDIERDHLLSQAEKSVLDANDKKINDVEEFFKTCNYVEKITAVITDPQEGEKIRLSVIRNEKQLEKEEAIENDRIEGAISREEITDEEKETGQNLDEMISGHEETTHKEALENPMSEEEKQKWEKEYQEEFDSHTRRANF